ncbi:MAG: winged helix-turn-helix domain-containing protein [Prevotella sp.]|nr:winged helix-turn-helix domain-containing protein [Prevotella sp.]MBP5278813.1 winged helix-turn-helix domain-containing protein [Prevotella sp.]MBQ3828423.1 winged helix-turn-helix domain-containing protein [Prevotella sp.]MBQ4445035.1 winged helix-turn-helix domain-containing protein [Prevotella sp.]MBQ6033838.1 winged helix-turn-helix domain-containing protein [Prevotella sp.]
MAEKKTTKAAAAKVAEAPKKETVKKATKKVAAKKVISYTAENVGFKAGDVYQALATAQKALSVKEIAAQANIAEEEVLLGAGWLLKEGKITEAEGKIVLA